MRRIILFVILVVAIQFNSCKSDPCETLKKEQLEVDLDQLGSAQKGLSKLSVCGFDSVDCILAGYVLGEICTQKMISTGTLNVSSKRFMIPYSELVDKLNQFKQASTYDEFRKEIIQSKK